MAKRIRNTAVAAAIAVGLGGASAAQASNWILLQGTEPFGKAHTLQMWGFMQPTFRQVDDGDKIDTGGAVGIDGNRPIFNTLGPDRTSNQSFSLFRARLGARGVMHPVNDKINYFFLAEFGQNGITRLDDQDGSISPKLTDASVTYRNFAGGGSEDPWKPGVSFRFGQFKMPMTDEGSRGIMSFDYINFSEVTRQQVLERYVRANSGSKAGMDGSISAFRDIGLQLFDEIKLSDKWEATWAAAVGNGNGINRLDNDDNLDLYLRAQTAYVFDGVKRGGPRREDIKLFAWAQRGERRFDDNGDGVYQSNEQDFERNRQGVGFHVYKQPYRFSGEYIWGNGMVFNGAAPPVSDPSFGGGGGGNLGTNNVLPQIAPGDDNEFNGWYVEGGYFPIPNKLGVQARYDVLNRLSGTSDNYSSADERKFETVTLGLQYWNHPAKGQWSLNYRIRDLSAPDNDVADDIGSSMGNEIGLQYFMLFKNVAL
ncbi:MAG: hypothetical protein V5A50_06570, partial [Thiohalorhabdus sp.]